MVALLAVVALSFAAEEVEKKEELQTAEGNLYSGLGYAGGLGYGKHPLPLSICLLNV